MAVRRVPPDSSLPLVGYEARWRDASGASRRKLFKGNAKRRAETYDAEQRTARERGEVFDHATARRITVTDYARQWAAAQPHAPSTALRVRSNIANHIEDTTLGRMSIGSVRPSHVQAWVTGRSQQLSPGTTRLVLKLLRSVFIAAVEDGLIPRSPARRVKLPRVEKDRVVPLTVEQVQALADAMQPRLRAMVITQAGLGLRLGELIGLRVQDVDFLHRVVRIEGQNQKIGRSYATTKTHRSKRTVPLPDVVAQALAAYLAQFPAGEDGTLFVNSLGRSFAHEHYGFRHFKAAVAKAGLPSSTSSHDLRHAFVSWHLDAGTSVAEVAELIGDTIEVVISTYAHQMPGGEDRARRLIDGLWQSGAGVSHDRVQGL